MRICAIKNKNYAKREASKPIIFNNPRDRYTLDLSELPYFIDSNDNKKYALNIIVIFEN